MTTSGSGGRHGRVAGKIALVTGAARGQGRGHAIRLAEEGADLILVDVCGPVETSFAPPTTADDLAETARQVRAVGGRACVQPADVRDLAALDTAVANGVAELGGLDIAVANAGIVSLAPALELTEEHWRQTLDVNLTGVWRTAKVSVPHIKQRGGGSLVLISSTGGERGFPNLAHYCASKHGVIGLARVLAQELAADEIRVNVICPGVVNTLMNNNPGMLALVRPDLPDPQWIDAADALKAGHLLPRPWMEPSEISEAVLWLASDQARAVTGVVLPVDMGVLVK